MNKTYQKTFSGVKNAGFTLIELLVVVLIIGILAAVALPQYQTVIDKAAFAEVMSVTHSLKDAMELYYLAHGRYPGAGNDWELDFDMPTKCTRTKGYNTFYCTDSWYDMNGQSGVDGYNGARYQTGSGAPRNLYRVSLNGKRYCLAIDSSSRARRLCKALGGKMVGSSVDFYEIP